MNLVTQNEVLNIAQNDFSPNSLPNIHPIAQAIIISIALHRFIFLDVVLNGAREGVALQATPQRPLGCRWNVTKLHQFRHQLPVNVHPFTRYS